MKKLCTIDIIALVILIIGGLNWGLVGFFKYDLVEALFGNMTAVSRIIYALVGLSGLYTAIRTPHLTHMETRQHTPRMA